ncbi:tryptorubin family RiPP precursor [Streptomyces rimosus]|uniref:tryptorubin family RiPP precursor n=1 Tax=Streptomyces rimosus TaxID=1927 RepID=UPI00373AF325
MVASSRFIASASSRAASAHHRHRYAAPGGASTRSAVIGNPLHRCRRLGPGRRARGRSRTSVEGGTRRWQSPPGRWRYPPPGAVAAAISHAGARVPYTPALRPRSATKPPIPRIYGDLDHIDVPFAAGLHFALTKSGKPDSVAEQCFSASRSAGVSVRFSRFACPGGAVMKLINSLKKKMKAEKSLKAYAWYIWY